MKELCILSAPNGSGLSSSRYVFEELGYYIVQNVPVTLVPELLNNLDKDVKITRIVLVTPIENALATYRIAGDNKKFKLTLIILSAEKDVLLKRFTLTRHVHPSTIGTSLTLEQAIDNDLKYVNGCMEHVGIFIDTSNLEISDLRKQLTRLLSLNKKKGTSLTFISYGLKNGTPKGLDTSFDVRIIPNPYWLEDLRDLSGGDQKVIDYLLSFPITMKTINKIIDYLDFFIPELLKKERPNYNIGIACSGGCHRSTFVANYIAKHYARKYNTAAIHRDTPHLNN